MYLDIKYGQAVGLLPHQILTRQISFMAAEAEVELMITSITTTRTILCLKTLRLFRPYFWGRRMLRPPILRGLQVLMMARCWASPLAAAPPLKLGQNI